MLGRSMISCLAALAVMAAACDGTAPGSPMTSPVATMPAGDDQAAVDALCDPREEASLANVASQLDNYEQADHQALSRAMAATTASLQMLTLGPDGMSIRDSGIGLMADLSAGVDDPATRASTTTAAAQTLRELESQICPPAAS